MSARRRHRNHDPESYTPTPKPTYLATELKTDVESMSVKLFCNPVGRLSGRFHRVGERTTGSAALVRVNGEDRDKKKILTRMYLCLYIVISTRRWRYPHSTLGVSEEDFGRPAAKIFEKSSKTWRRRTRGRRYIRRGLLRERELAARQLRI